MTEGIFLLVSISLICVTAFSVTIVRSTNKIDDRESIVNGQDLQAVVC